ncbi:MAG: polysaccharide deacetylase family protein [Planctomycetota bacterium]
MTTHALTFDLEEWFHLVGVRAMDDRAAWSGFEPTVERETGRILDLLAEHETRATFFVLGWVADRYPALINRIAEAGHELGSHSFWHYEVYRHTRQSFQADIAASIDAIEQAGGTKVLGFRAPSFSLVPGCEWALDVLLDQGLVYDASIFPARRAHGGYPSGRWPDTLATPSGRTIHELPMSLYEFGPMRVPFSGGGYLRLMPTRLIHHAIRQHERYGRPAVVYLHPWDFAPGGPRTAMPLTSRIKCYEHRSSTAPKLASLLQRYRFDRCAKLLGLDATANL